jgi:hypothetical protein
MLERAPKFFSDVDNQADGIDFNWDFDTTLANHRIIIKISQNYSGSCFEKAPTHISHSFFYMKAWVCPSTHPFFKMATLLCENLCAAYQYGNTLGQYC